MKILVIDDEKPTLSMFKLFLTAYGYEVTTAESGEAGLALFKEFMPDIVFTDIKMPGMDGLEVLRRIKTSHPATEVIIITGHGDMEKALEALDLNASDFINKPVERQALNSALVRAENRAQLKGNQDFHLKRHDTEAGLDIRVAGRLTGKVAQSLKALSTACTEAGTARMDFHFDDSFSVDREGIQALMATLMEIRKKKVDVTMEGLSYSYMRFFCMAGMDKLVTFTPLSLDADI